MVVGGAPGERRALLPLVARPVAAVAAGVLLAWSFPPYDRPWLAPIAVAVLTVACWRRGAWAGAGLGLLAGAAFFGVLVRWLGVVGDDAWLLLTAYCALWLGLVGLGTALVTRLPTWPLWVGGVWVLDEALRGRVPLGGFPWGRLAFSQSATELTPLAALGGTALVTFATAVVGALLAGALVAMAPRVVGRPRWGAPPPRRPAAALAALAVVAGILALGRLVPLPTAGQDAGGPAEVTAAVVQGNVPELGLDFNSQRRAVLDNHVRETERLAAEVAAGRVPQPDIVVWPENASDLDPYLDAEAAALITRAVDAIGAPTLVGAVVLNQADPTTVLNVGIVWEPGTGPGERYVKRHPVPFGEYVPFRSVLAPLVGRFDRIPRDFAPGTDPGVLQLGPALIGDVICFEVAYDREVRDVVDAGARALVVQTNNATYGRTGQPEQQLAMSRLRAVEHGRTVLVAATSGISAIIAPDGTVTAQAPEFTADSLVARVALRDTLTLADRLGTWPEWLLAALGLVGMAWAAAARGIRSDDDSFTEGTTR